MNSEMLNKNFAHKKTVLTGSIFSSAREVSDYDEWTPDIIEERSAKITEWALERWPDTKF